MLLLLVLGLALAGCIWIAVRTPSPPEQPAEFPSLKSRERALPKGEGSETTWEGNFWEVNDPKPLTLALQLDYTDARGTRTSRKVDVRQFGHNGYGLLLLGHCRLRNDIRTFRVDRIKEAVDLNTGAVITHVEKFLLDSYKESPHAGADRLLDEEYDALRVLLFVGKADGRLTAPEKAVIRASCKKITSQSVLSDEAIELAFKNLDVPTLAAFKLAVGRIAARSRDIRATMIESAKAMIATQKSVHPAEAEALAYMEKRLTEKTSAADAPESA